MEQLELHYVDGGSARILELRGEAITIGRIEGNDLVINHPSVSRRHATARDARLASGGSPT